MEQHTDDPAPETAVLFACDHREGSLDPFLEGTRWRDQGGETVFLPLMLVNLDVKAVVHSLQCLAHLEKFGAGRGVKMLSMIMLILIRYPLMGLGGTLGVVLPLPVLGNDISPQYVA